MKMYSVEPTYKIICSCMGSAISCICSGISEYIPGIYTEEYKQFMERQDRILELRKEYAKEIRKEIKDLK